MKLSTFSISSCKPNKSFCKASTGTIMSSTSGKIEKESKKHMDHLATLKTANSQFVLDSTKANTSLYTTPSNLNKAPFADKGKWVTHISLPSKTKTKNGTTRTVTPPIFYFGGKCYYLDNFISE